MPSLNPVKYIRFINKVLKGAKKAKGRTDLTLLQQFKEVYGLLRLNKMEPHEYYDTYELWSPGRTWEQKKTFMSRNQFALMYINLDPPKEMGVFNKHVFNIYARTVGLPVADDYGLFHPHYGQDMNGNDLKTFQQFEKLINNLEVNDFVLKPIGADKGHGILICQKKSGGKVLVNNTREMTLSEIFNEIRSTHHNENPRIIDSYLIQERVIQHPFFDQYSKVCTQSIRFLCYAHLSGEIEIISRHCKFGEKDKHIDNVQRRGIATSVDENGVFRKAFRMTSDYIIWYDRHPDTDAQITDVQIPEFAEAARIAVKANALLPQMRTIGWDIVISKKGPVILEGNSYYGWQVPQAGSPTGLMKGEVAKEVYKLMRKNS